MNKPIKLYFDYKNCKDGDIHCPNCDIRLFPIDSDNDDKNEYYYKLIYGE